jgi:hypothetical protein
MKNIFLFFLPTLYRIFGITPYIFEIGHKKNGLTLSVTEVVRLPKTQISKSAFLRTFTILEFFEISHISVTRT